MAEYTGTHVNVFYVDGANGHDGFNGQHPSVPLSGTVGPWKTIQHGFDNIADGTIGDGDELRIMATKVYHIGAPLTLTWSSKEVVITGATSGGSGLVDGTIVEINGNTGAMDGATMMYSSVNSLDQVVFSHLYCNAADNAKTCYHQSVSGSNGVQFVNCRFSSATEYGFVIDASSYYRFFNCRFDNNASDGLRHNGSQFGLMYKCLCDNNGGNGANLDSILNVVECVFFGNSGDGCQSYNNTCTYINNIFDSNFDNGCAVAGSNQSVHLGNIYSNNGSGGAAGSGIVVYSGAEARLYNCQFYNNDTTWATTGGTDHLSMYNCVTGGSDPGFLQPYGPTFDFTPTATFSGIGNGIPIPFTWFGSTADDIGLNKWKSSESISVF